MEIIQHFDMDLADHCQRGLAWEVLSYKMAEEEPTAFEIIQAALNGLATVIADTGQGMADEFNWRPVLQSKDVAGA
mgnify:FL=1